jgi:DNA-binding transcriptional ArsR family regulator
MERDLLEGYLAEGLSLEQIGNLTGRDGSTVGYWVAKHGLEAAHRGRHAARGGIPREVLERLVQEGLSMRKIASRVGMSQSTVRHWLRQYGLRTERQAGTRSSGDRSSDPARRTLECPRHGSTEFWLDKRGGYRCLRCRSEAVSKRRRRLKAILVEDSGGHCEVCGYNRCVAALHFHHRDGSTKAFGLADRGYTRSLDTVRREAAKCVLLCSNCHAEVEAGMVTLP